MEESPTQIFLRSPGQHGPPDKTESNMNVTVSSLKWSTQKNRNPKPEPVGTQGIFGDKNSGGVPTNAGASRLCCGGFGEAKVSKGNVDA